MSQILADTGPLVALFNPRDQFHAWARSRFEEFTNPLLTSETVLAECLFLSAKSRGATAKLLALWERDLLQVRFSAETEKPALLRLLKKYESLPISLADASLVRMAEIHSDPIVWTLDRHFGVYRRHGRQVIPAISPHR